jgi:hypothetical protein
MNLVEMSLHTSREQAIARRVANRGLAKRAKRHQNRRCLLDIDLFWLITYGDAAYDKVAAALRRGANANGVRYRHDDPIALYDTPPLFLAIECRASLIELLCEYGAEVCGSRFRHWPPVLAISVYFAPTDCLRLAELLLVRGANPNFEGQRGLLSPLMAFVKNKNYDVVRALIRAGADVKATERSLSSRKSRRTVLAYTNRAGDDVMIALVAAPCVDERREIF